jgi:transcriptional regulator with XRE-family HTH domain
MARAALGWGVREIAEAANVSPNTIARLERGDGLKPRTLQAVRETFESAGVVFIPENGGGPGVRLRNPVGLPSATPEQNDPDHLPRAGNALSEHSSSCKISVKAAAKMMKVSEKMVRRAKAISDTDPDLAERIMAGDLTIPEAERIMAGRRLQERKPLS